MAEDTDLGNLSLLLRAANLIQDAFLITTSDLEPPGPRIVYVNRSFTKMTGYAATEVVGRSPRFLQGEDTSRDELAHLRGSLEEGLDFDGRLVNYRQDGSRFVVGLRIRPIRDADGQITHFFALQRDVTAEEESRARLEGLEQAVRQTQDSILMFEAVDGRVHWANAAYLAWAGIELEQAIGRPIWTLPGAPQSRDEIGWARRRLSQGRSWQREYEVHRGDGTSSSGPESRIVATTISPVRRNEEPPTDFVVISRDVTERKRIFDIEDAHRQADQIGKIFATIRHEFGNPVNSIKSALTVLSSEADPLSPRQARMVTRILDEVARLESHLVALRSFGMFDRLQIERIELRQLTQRIESLMASEMKAKRIDFRSSQVPGGFFVRLDEQATMHVFAQIFDNATDAVAEVQRPQVRLECQIGNKRARLAIHDNGKGMSKSELELAMLPFFTTKPRAAGLGLASVGKLVSQMRCTMALDSAPGMGTTVTLEVDLAEAP